MAPQAAGQIVADTSQATDGEKRAAGIAEKFWESAENMQGDGSEGTEGVGRQISEAEVQV